MKVCLDLFSGLGGFSAAFEDSEDWDVVTVDIEKRFNPDICSDIMDLEWSDLPESDVVLASPPCTYFSMAGHHEDWDKETRRPVSLEARKHVALVYHTLGLIHMLSPEYWYLENPIGRLRWIIGESTGTVTYCQYGTSYMKPTDLWGYHPDSMVYRTCKAGQPCHESNKSNDYNAIKTLPKSKSERSKVPYELSESILQAVESKGGYSRLF